MGKTALATKLLVHAARQARVALFSLEMTRAQLMSRMICCEGARPAFAGTRNTHDSATCGTTTITARATLTSTRIEEETTMSVESQSPRAQAETAPVALVAEAARAVADVCRSNPVACRDVRARAGHRISIDDLNIDGGAVVLRGVAPFDATDVTAL